MLFSIDALHASLLYLGAPQITRDDLSRLYKGPLAEALSFLANHVRGRRGCAFARQEILRVEETTRSIVDKANSRLAAAKKNLGVCMKQFDDKQETLKNSEAEFHRLESTLSSKRRVNLFLDVLEKKESIRLRRLQQMGSLLDALRKRIQDSDAQKLIPPLQIPPVPPRRSKRLPRISNMQDTLTALHAHHILLGQFVSQGQQQHHGVEERLRRRITQKVGEKHVERYFAKCRSIAQARARSRVGFQRLPPPFDVQKLEETQEVIGKKMKALQTLSNHTIALGFLCDHFIKAGLTFGKTSKTLRTSLEEEGKETNGYIDGLRHSITAGDGSFSVEESAGDEGRWGKDVLSVLGLKGNQSVDGVLRNVERVVRMAHQTETFLTQAVLLPPLEVTGEERGYITEFKEKATEVNESMKVLKRKNEKVGIGLAGVVRDVEVILGEREIVGSGGLD